MECTRITNRKLPNLKVCTDIAIAMLFKTENIRPLFFNIVIWSPVFY